MSDRLQKKCLVGSATGHLILALGLFAGAALVPSPKHDPENLQPINFVPSRLIDEAFANAGGSPGPAVAPAPAPAPAESRPEIKPDPKPERRPEPKPAPPEPEPSKAPDPAPSAEPAPSKRPSVDAPPKKARPVIKPNLSKVVKGGSSRKADTSKARAQAAERARAAAAERFANTINSAVKGLAAGLSSSTTIESPGGGFGESYASYSQEIMRIYEEAWRPPTGVGESAGIVKARVVVTREGDILSDPIISRSGNGTLDRSVQEALERVRAGGKLPPFPEGAKDLKRTFIINFNLLARRQIG